MDKRNRKGTGRNTQDEARKEEIDPGHDDGLWNEHDHIALHHIHHSIHSSGIGQWVRRRCSSVLWIFQVFALLECSLQEAPSSFNDCAWENVGILTKENGAS
jgi:hypothetical protein